MNPQCQKLGGSRMLPHAAKPIGQEPFQPYNSQQLLPQPAQTNDPVTWNRTAGFREVDTIAQLILKSGTIICYISTYVHLPRIMLIFYIYILFNLWYMELRFCNEIYEMLYLLSVLNIIIMDQLLPFVKSDIHSFLFEK